MGYKLHQTAEAFSIKLCAYAVMSNHYHMVLGLRPDMASKLSKINVVRRWYSLVKGTYLIQCYQAGSPLFVSQLKVVEKDIEVWRERLSSLSWFMKTVNESIARRTNLEDKCTGHFSVYPKVRRLLPRYSVSLQSWESRVKSQALLDGRALLACMTYVALNPIRANMVDSPRIDSLESNTQPKRSIENVVGTDPNAKSQTIFQTRDIYRR